MPGVANIKEAAPAPPRLFSKIAAVMGELNRVPKRGRNEFHKYDYATEADIVDEVRQHLAKQNVALLQSLESVQREGTITTVIINFTFADGDSGETWTGRWAGTGDDKTDKGIYKAFTGCLKYWLTKTFLLPTGDDPERDDPRDRKKAESKPKGKPEGYDDWLADMAATADNGEAALRKAWSSSNIDYRAYLTEVDEAKWVGIKVRAKNADAGAIQ